MTTEQGSVQPSTAMEQKIFAGSVYVKPNDDTPGSTVIVIGEKSYVMLTSEDIEQLFHIRGIEQEIQGYNLIGYLVDMATMKERGMR